MLKGAIACIVVAASVQLAAAFAPHLAPSSFGGRSVHARSATAVRRNVRLAATFQLKAADTNTALSEFSGVDASGNQVERHRLQIKFLHFNPGFDMRIMVPGHVT
jgi:hypothetical protein